MNLPKKGQSCRKGKYIIVETDDAGGGGGAPMGKLTAVRMPRGCPGASGIVRESVGEYSYGYLPVIAI